MFRFTNLDLFDAVKEVGRGFSEQDTNAEPNEAETSHETFSLACALIRSSGPVTCDLKTA